jgi:hypothetical protein
MSEAQSSTRKPMTSATLTGVDVLKVLSCAAISQIGQ